MDYHFISSTANNIAGIWTMILIIGNVWGIIHSIGRKYTWGIIEGSVLGILSIWLFEIEILPYHLFHLGKPVPTDYERFLPPGGIFVLGMVLISIGTVSMVIYSVYDWVYTVNSRTIKYCSDAMPVGICYSSFEGRVILSNACMKRICYELTGRALLNAEEFIGMIPEEYITLSDGSVWKSEINDILIDEIAVRELIFTDISELVQKRRRLEEKNLEIAGLNEKLKAYQLDIDEYIKQKEILQAKIDIHDEMNKLMLMTMAAVEEQDESLLDEALASWAINAGIINSEGDKSDADYGNVESLANMLGISINGQEYVKDIPNSKKELFCTIFREALINISKHSSAVALELSVFNNRDGTTICFENGGVYNDSAAEVPFVGGLLNLKHLVEAEGGSIKAEICEKCYRLEVRLPS